MSNTAERVLAGLMCAVVLASQSVPAFAQFTGGGAAASSWFVQMCTPLIPLAVGVVGVMCLAGRINWGWFGAFIAGACLFFGRDQVVTLVRGWMGV